MFKATYRLFHRHYHQRYHGVYRHAKKLFIFDLILLGGALAMLSIGLILLFWRPDTTDLVDISLSLGANRIASGDRVNLSLNYTNRNKFPLQEAIVTLRLPAGFILEKPDTVFKIKEIAPGSTGELNVTGQLWTNLGADEKIVAVLTYQTEKNDFTEQKISTLLLNLPASTIATKLEVADNAFAKNKLPIVISLTNTSDKKIDSIILSHNWPGNIILTPTDAPTISLEPNENKIFNGYLITPDKNGAIPLEITTQVVIDGHPLVQSTLRRNINVISPNFSAQAEFVGMNFANPGQILPLKIKFKNNNSYDATNLRIRLVSAPGIVDWPATAQLNRLKLENGELIIDGTFRTILANAEPWKSDEFSINLRLKPHFSLSEKQIALSIQPIVEGQLPAVAEQKFSLPGSTASLPLPTEVNFSASPRYYTNEGDQLGRGPLPPMIGATTKYWIFVQASNTINNIQNNNFRAVLPSGVEWNGRQSITIGSPLKFNPTNRQITWSFPDIPSFSQIGLYFEVSVTPNESQVNQTITLLKDIEFETYDKITGKKFLFSIPKINNIISPPDPAANKSANVVPVE